MVQECARTKEPSGQDPLEFINNIKYLDRFIQLPDIDRLIAASPHEYAYFQRCFCSSSQRLIYVFHCSTAFEQMHQSLTEEEEEERSFTSLCVLQSGLQSVDQVIKCIIYQQQMAELINHS